MNVKTLVFVVVGAICWGRSDAKGKEPSFSEVIAKCGSDAKDDHPSSGSRCLVQFNDAIRDSNGTFFFFCEKQYCMCAGHTWNDTTGACSTETSTCGLGCGCMERCYADFLKCSYYHIVRAMDTEDCKASGLKECVEDADDEMRDECKRGVEEGRISWMDTPLPEDCDEDLICAGSTYSPIGFFALLLTLTTVLLN